MYQCPIPSCHRSWKSIYLKCSRAFAGLAGTWSISAHLECEGVLKQACLPFISFAPIQAAKTALRTVITPLRARELAAAHAAALPDLRGHVVALLVEGVLSEDYVLQARA